MPPVCQAAGASIIGGGAPSWITERHYYYRTAVGAKRVENSVNAIQKWVPFTKNTPKSVGGWGSAPDHPITRESAFGACQSDKQS